MIVLTWWSQVLLSYLRNRRLPIILGPFARSCTQKSFAKAGVSNVLDLKQFTTRPRKWWATVCTCIPTCVGTGWAHAHAWPLLTHNYSLSPLPRPTKNERLGNSVLRYHLNTAVTMDPSGQHLNHEMAPKLSFVHHSVKRTITMPISHFLSTQPMSQDSCLRNGRRRECCIW